jgi:lipopolysaccharide/colanic/teichoic acid biosynthesis glycosyltransferase
MRSRTAKRLVDLTLAVPAIVVLTPLMAVLALAVAVGLGRPILFRQSRPGLDGKPFTILKFRTMRNAITGAAPLSDADRLGPFGAWLRSTSLDELPELWNVVKGDMSLVGPRPLLLHYLPLYSASQRRRHEVRPGITGWAQINGRNARSWTERLEMDVWYVDNWSIGVDIKILALTLLSVLRRDGISAPGAATMPEFPGSREECPGSSDSDP